MLDLSQVSFSLPVSFCQLLIQASWLSYIDVVGLEVKSSALKRTFRPYNNVVFFSECIVWLTGSLGLTTSPYVNEFNTFFGITLISCPLLHGSVGFSKCVMEFNLQLFYYFYLFRKKGCLLMVSRAAIIKCWDIWHKWVGLVFK